MTLSPRVIGWAVVCVGVVLVLWALMAGWNDIARLLPWTSQARAANAEAQLAPALASVEALDAVAVETPAIRADQKEKEDAVDNLQGADAPLPAGFGADIERLRHTKRGDHP